MNWKSKKRKMIQPLHQKQMNKKEYAIKKF